MSRKKVIPLIRSPDTSSTWTRPGRQAARRIGLVLAVGASAIGHDRDQARSLAADPRPQAPVDDVLVGLQPHGVRRHVPGGVFPEQRGQRVHVVPLEGVDVARQQGGVLRIHRVMLVRGPALVGRQRRPRALKGAVDRCDRGVEQLRHLVRMPAQHLAQDQHRSLPRRQVLQRGHEGQLHRFARHRDLGRVAGGGQHPPIGHGLDPGALDQRRRQGLVGRGRRLQVHGPGASLAGAQHGRGRRWWRCGTASERRLERPSNRSRLRHARTKVSCTASSASKAEPSIR